MSGYFSIDPYYYQDGDGQDGAWIYAWEAAAFGPSWNGWASPRVTESVAKKVCKAQQLHMLEDDSFDDWQYLERTVGEWGIRIVTQDGDIHWIMPDADDGLFDIGFGYCWQRVDDDTKVIFEFAMEEPNPLRAIPVHNEFTCGLCGETFIGNTEFDVIHLYREDGRPCGGSAVHAKGAAS